MRKFIFALSVVFCFLSGGPALSQSASTAPEEYLVGYRDQLYIGIWAGGNLEYEVLEQEVSAQGTIPLIWVGDIRVEGLTEAQIRDKITAILADGYFKDPVVIVKVVDYKSKEVAIHGAVARPGTYSLDTNTTTLVKLITVAGGMSSQRSNQAFIYRGGARLAQKGENDSKEDDQQNKAEAPSQLPDFLQGQERITVSLSKLFEKGDTSLDLVIYPGDLVYIPSKELVATEIQYVYVDGQVKNPKKLDYQEGMTALQAIIECGGFTDVAAPNKTKLTRTDPDGEITVTKLRLKDVQKGKRPDVKLKPGDRITVPEGWI